MRPSLYSEKLVDEICSLLAEGYSLVTICKREGMPNYSTVSNWLDKYPEFLTKYTRAREQQADYLAEEIIGIADEKLSDPQRSRLQVDARKWYAGKLRPKKYGDKIQNEHSGPDGGAIQTESTVRPTITREEWLKLNGL